MQECAHCRELFMPVGSTPLINRTDGRSFHVTLFVGPNPRENPAGGFFTDQSMCSFWYVHDRLGPARKYLVVYILDTKTTVEELADMLAELVQEGVKLRALYTLANGKLRPGLPSAASAAGSGQ